MSVTVELDTALRHGLDIQDSIQVDGKNVRECLMALVRRFPILRERLFEDDTQLHIYIVILVDGKTTYPRELPYPVKDGSKLTVMTFVAGG